MTWTSSSNIGAIKTTDLQVPKLGDDSWRYTTMQTFQFAYTHCAIFQDFECVPGFEKSRACACEARKYAFFLFQGEYLV